MDPHDHNSELPASSANVLTAPSQEELDAKFQRLALEWKAATEYLSNSTKMAMHPAYQRIIGIGPSVVPLLLRELEREVDHWFWALQAITGEDPVPPETRGKMK